MKKILIPILTILFLALLSESYFLIKLKNDNNTFAAQLSDISTNNQNNEKLSNTIDEQQKEIEKLKTELSESSASSNKQEKKDKIDINLEKCMEKDYSTAGMNNCSQEGQKAWEQEISKNSAIIKKNLDSEGQQLFEEAQKAWQDYYEKEQKFIHNTIGQVDGTIHTNYAYGECYDLAKARAKAISSYNFDLEN